MKHIILIIILCFSFTTFVKSQNSKEDIINFDKNLAEKYNLNVIESDSNSFNVPDWFKNLDMITNDFWWKNDSPDTSKNKLWKGYGFKLEDTLINRIVRLRQSYGKLPSYEQKLVTIDGYLDGALIDGVKLISHVPHSKKAFQQAHDLGFKVIPYVHFKDIHTNYADQDVYYFQHPEILLKSKQGEWKHLHMDGTDRLFRLLVCANSPSYWRLSLDYVKKLMDWGADGIFIDNVGHREECYGQNFNKRSPELEPYVHEHLFPNATQDYAFDRFLQTIRAFVKSYGKDKIVILNSGIGTDLQKDGDCSMVESFIYSWAWKGRAEKYSWANIKKIAENNKWLTKSGNRITALSYLNAKRKEVKEDAFWAFGAARLTGMIWWANLANTGSEILYKVHLGKPISSLIEKNEVAYKIFENGIVVLNNSKQNVTLKIKTLSEFNYSKVFDLYNNQKEEKIRNLILKVSVPKKSVRIYYGKKLE